MTAVEERRLKVLLKDAVAEVLEERQDLLRAAVQESLEDAAMLRAICVGEKTRPVSRNKIFQRLARAAGTPPSANPSTRICPPSPTRPCCAGSGKSSNRSKPHGRSSRFSTLNGSKPPASITVSVWANIALVLFLQTGWSPS